MRKGEVVCNKQFLLFSQCFLPYYGTYFPFKMSAICFNMHQSKILLSGNGLTLYQATKCLSCPGGMHLLMMIENQKMEYVLKRLENICGQRRKCCLALSQM